MFKDFLKLACCVSMFGNYAWCSGIGEDMSELNKGIERISIKDESTQQNVTLDTGSVPIDSQPKQIDANVLVSVKPEVQQTAKTQGRARKMNDNQILEVIEALKSKNIEVTARNFIYEVNEKLHMIISLSTAYRYLNRIENFNEVIKEKFNNDFWSVYNAKTDTDCLEARHYAYGETKSFWNIPEILRAALRGDHIAQYCIYREVFNESCKPYGDEKLKKCIEAAAWFLCSLHGNFHMADERGMQLGEGILPKDFSEKNEVFRSIKEIAHYWAGY